MPPYCLQWLNISAPIITITPWQEVCLLEPLRYLDIPNIKVIRYMTSFVIDKGELVAFYLSLSMNTTAPAALSGKLSPKPSATINLLNVLTYQANHLYLSLLLAYSLADNSTSLFQNGQDYNPRQILCACTHCQRVFFLLQ